MLHAPGISVFQLIVWQQALRNHNFAYFSRLYIAHFTCVHVFRWSKSSEYP